MNIEKDDLIEKLVSELSQLPSIGRKSAQRLAFFLLNQPTEKVKALTEAINEAKHKIRECQRCHNFTELELCKICSSANRHENLICVVEKPVDILLVERFGFYQGVYHVLGGSISPLDGIGPDELHFHSLKQRLLSLQEPEIILALPTNSDGEATSLYLMKWLKEVPVKISRLARGIPLGSDLSFVDEKTMQKAMEHRVLL